MRRLFVKVILQLFIRNDRVGGGLQVGLFEGCLVGLLCLVVCGIGLLLWRLVDRLRSRRGSLLELEGSIIMLEDERRRMGVKDLHLLMA